MVVGALADRDTTLRGELQIAGEARAKERPVDLTHVDDRRIQRRDRFRRVVHGIDTGGIGGIERLGRLGEEDPFPADAGGQQGAPEPQGVQARVRLPPGRLVDRSLDAWLQGLVDVFEVPDAQSACRARCVGVDAQQRSRRRILRNDAAQWCKRQGGQHQDENGCLEGGCYLETRAHDGFLTSSGGVIGRR